MIYLIRHGETRKNKEKLLQGRSNEALNEEGIRQAEQVRDYFAGKGIHFDKVYSSPLSRAVQTAKIVAGEELQVIEDQRLLEMDYGPFEGSSLESPAPEIIYFFSDFANHPAPEGMESLDSVVGRLGEFLQTLDADPQENILVATHAIAMKGALEYLTPESKGAYWSRYLGNCAVYSTASTEDGYTVPEEIYTPDKSSKR